MIGPQVSRSSGSRTRPTKTPGVGTSSRVIGTLVSLSRDSNSLGIVSPAKGCQTSSATSSCS